MSCRRPPSRPMQAHHQVTRITALGIGIFTEGAKVGHNGDGGTVNLSAPLPERSARGDEPGEYEQADLRNLSAIRLRDAIAGATGKYREDLIHEAIKRVTSFPRAWLPWDSRGITA
jgi:hypothetical protein